MVEIPYNQMPNVFRFRYVIIRHLENQNDNQQLNEGLVLLCKKMRLLVYSVLSFFVFDFFLRRSGISTNLEICVKK